MASHLYEFKDAYALFVGNYGEGYYLFDKSSNTFIDYIERDPSSNCFIQKSVNAEIIKCFNKIRSFFIYDSERDKLNIYKQFSEKGYTEVFKI
ncbi:hypothetical protein SAMN04487895_101586 [Paenibacillus sophorae]|uniref:Uncharacterized protein n=1 Tax=Paenibacillus sophorae TaxID=1333845 RepID=A0A1H8GNX6_9BACL|nr:hypothetical protein SAMN04487895_101586 [Paenibacillus sophorae]